MRSTDGFRSFRSLLVFVLAHMAAGCGTGDVPPLPMPNCLQTLFSACPTDSACHSREISGPRATRSRYADGTQTDYTRTGVCGDGRIVVQVRKPDGSLCYMNEVTPGLLCESEVFSWKDPSGRLIATGSSGYDSPSVGVMFTCASGGEPMICDDTQCQLGSWWRTPNCQPGDCP